MSNTAGKVATGLGVAATAAQAIPVFGQVAGAILGIGAGLAGFFGRRRRQAPPPAKLPLAPARQQKPTTDKVLGTSQGLSLPAPPELQLSAPSSPQTSEPRMVQAPSLLQNPNSAGLQLSNPLNAHKSDFLMRALIRNSE